MRSTALRVHTPTAARAVRRKPATLRWGRAANGATSSVRHLSLVRDARPSRSPPPMSYIHELSIQIAARTGHDIEVVRDVVAT